MTEPEAERVSTGVEGLDEVLHGGFLPRRGYLLSGRPGTGKTILGLHYLRAGLEAGESCLFVNLESTKDDIRSDAESLGFDLEGLEFLDLSPGAEVFTSNEQYDIFAPGEVEGPDISSVITERVAEIDPDRVFVDPLSQFRALSPDVYQFRKLINGFLQFVRQHEATVLFTSQATDLEPDEDLQYVSDGTITLGRGEAGRTLAVEKFRGSATKDGPHAVRIGDTGLEVYPRISPSNHQRSHEFDQISSGVPEIDELLHGGIERGTVTVLSGPTGVGKTTLGTQFMKEAAGRGERSVMYLFEENRETFLKRSVDVNIPTAQMLDRGTLEVQEVEALERSPEEFASFVRAAVEERDARIVMIDGIDGYRLSLNGRSDELRQKLHSLVTYLKNMGVAVILVDTVDDVTGDFKPTESGLSYLADSIVFLRYLEMAGELNKAIGVLKKRTSDFERALRAFEITEHGIKVGSPLTELRGIMSGTPEFHDGNPVRAIDRDDPNG